MKKWFCQAGRLLALPVWLACGPAPAWPVSSTDVGQAPAPEVVTLREGVEAAWLRSPWRQAVPAREAQQAAAREIADAWLSAPPSVSVGRRGNQSGTGSPKQEWEAEWRAPLWRSGQRAAEQARVDRDAALLSAEIQAQRLEVAGRVRSVWWSVWKAWDQLAWWQGRADAAQTLEADVGRRHQAGELARVDLQMAKADGLAARGEVAEATRAWRAAQAQWEALTGLPWRPPRDAQRLAPETPTASLEATEVDLEAHPALLAARQAAAAAQVRVDAAALAARPAPEVALRVVRERRGADDPFANTLGVRLSVPLGGQAQVSRASAEARAAWVEGEAHVTVLAAQLRATWAEAVEAARTAHGRLAMARDRAALTADNVRLVSQAFRMGETDLATLLRARVAAFDADLDVRQQSRALAIAHDQLQQALGRLP